MSQQGEPTTTEAEHPQPGFDHAGFTQIWQDYVAVIAHFFRVQNTS